MIGRRLVEANYFMCEKGCMRDVKIYEYNVFGLKFFWTSVKEECA